MGIDVVQPSNPEDTFHDEHFYLPPRLDEEFLEEADYQIHPELREIDELKNLIW